MMRIIKKAAAKRRKLGLSIREASVLVGVSFSTLARLERNEGGPSMAVARKIQVWIGEKLSPASPEERIADLERRVKYLETPHVVTR